MRDEMKDLGLVEALQRILTLTMQKIRSVGVVGKDVALALVDIVMGVAVDMLKTEQRLLRNNLAITAR